ncbi:hypothetical protein KIKIMORA_05100 [Brevundimonas phage vB_BpoS-Kikimora]|uniref:Uncharacterized protein n=1 Tax=Brevundimonas phage vB_BpoS-Kikimora TaxID=2948601 RepID=A0A9E7MSH7_9CAUD|nr:hypothetical protein KIKIMORA_05100 [Brevundimonas phage vB_BpoS-Kikimora]
MSHQYVVGSNVPGYLPEEAPAGPMDWQDAVQMLRASLDADLDAVLETADTDPDYVTWLENSLQTVLIDADLETDSPDEQPEGVEVTFIDRVYFIAPEGA